MASRLPPVSGGKIVRLPASLGYEIVRQRGSPIRMRSTRDPGQHSVTISAHREVAKGTLNDILNEVSIWASGSKSTLIDALRGM